jgi:hypothetical protein
MKMEGKFVAIIKEMKILLLLQLELNKENNKKSGAFYIIKKGILEK